MSGTSTHEAVLRAVRAVAPLGAADAVAWFGNPPGAEVVGYALSPRAATWVRVHADGIALDGRGGDDTLADAYEVVLFDGERELRWLRTPDGLGTAVAIGEDPAGLPAGEDVTAVRSMRRRDTVTRLLEGTPEAHANPGWTTLRTSRYAEAHVPCPYLAGDRVLVIDSVEYVVEDDHGNRDVVDARTIGLRSIHWAEVATPDTYATTGPERTTP